ncbi:hypothetical protein [Nitrososphaera viennensis]|uniref:Uncharacterized protein n=2 Tax=Nitrososphaera viennensis TaxID=1034015 RepID=A0A060HFI7_9ARCH|nr:hypothetical protein [Nitrososphaera viennensis]AIC14353.1 hypothetical protein NVIE_001700 [Nitrososphaera viennensis EN76]UVS69341.1 hypothetical protein NWT39_00810 [Nitrososphaera viennensis]
MGAVFRPGDITKGRKSIIQNALKDTHPDIRKQILDLLSSWEGTKSEEKLMVMMGKEKAETFLKEISKQEEKRDNSVNDKVQITRAGMPAEEEEEERAAKKD